MCGIAGIFAPQRITETTVAQARAMGDAIAHRGPDDQGEYNDRDVALVHKRLSIIDLETGRQPLFNEDRSLVLIFNGEIYNYRELTADLKARGHRFATRTDSEVILHAYEEQGPDCVKLFNGMFAFALWDAKARRLVAARDRLGIKPFYYSETPHGFVFASEAKALVKSGLVPAALNEEALLDFLTFQNLLDEKTFFQGIRKLPAGHHAVIDEKGLKLTRYWDVDFSRKLDLTPAEACARFREIFDRAVTRHMISDVPVGAYLSGGFDSTAVACTASRLSDFKMSTFTGAFPLGLPYDERVYSREVARSIGAHMYEVEFTPADFRDHLSDVVYHLDEPSIGSGALPQYLVSRMVSEHVKVVLTGHGGDELFSGYQVFKAHLLMRRLAASPGRALALLAGVRPSEIAHILYFALYPRLIDPDVRYGLFIMNSSRQRRALLADGFARRARDYDPFATLHRLIADREFDQEDRLTYLYLKTYLPTLLLQEDKVGMAHSLEARIPLCDNEVVEFATSLRSDTKLSGLTLKYVTKEAMRDRLPASLYGATKKGFPTPIALWFRGALRDFVTETLDGPDTRLHAYIDRDRLRGQIRRFLGLRTVHLYDYAAANRLYSLMTVEYWLRRFLGN